MPVALHIGGAGPQAPLWDGFNTMTLLAMVSTMAITSNVQVIANVLFSGVLNRFPRLKFVSVESGCGWVPYLLETADHQWEAQRLWKHGMEQKPSEYFHRNCYVNFWYEVSGVKLREMVGIDNMMWEADFPHPTSTYPDSKKVIEQGLAGVPEDEREKLLYGNAVRVFNLDAEAIRKACAETSV